ncbi:Ctr copper transporter [Exidia glandulosa HHB12029]|uniref:Copper transport protein n=1 Tax=Exidia glandulosa HHB12029 TaxID=1314781 RepID=A0A165DH28_EXIGL|nr:Ctr copper transporter [Exidia glandulosa HHB12029]
MDMGSDANSTASDSMSMGGMDCKISMLWNWNTVDACFISKDWHITSKGMFAGTVIAIFFLVILVELVRRLAREYDRKIARDAAAFDARLMNSTAVGSDAKLAAVEGAPLATIARPIRQAVRSTLYMVQFGAGYMLMLLAMYYNGYILIFGIFFGAWAGHFLTAWDTVGHGEAVAKDCCC